MFISFYVRFSASVLKSGLSASPPLPSFRGLNEISIKSDFVDQVLSMVELDMRPLTRAGAGHAGLETAPGISPAPPAWPHPVRSQIIPDHTAIELDRLLDEVKRGLTVDLEVASNAAARLAAALASKTSDILISGRARGGLAPWQKRKVLQHVEDCLEGGLLRVEGLAKLVSLSESRFCRIFREIFGVTPHAYVLQRRTERAKILMLTTTESLSQIALACGLSDQAHLCRCFRKTVGMTPGAWRRIYAGDVRSVA